MQVVYSGCKYNSIVFVADQTQSEFLEWLNGMKEAVGEYIKANPAQFKFSSLSPSAMSVTTVSSNPDMYPNELRCRLSTLRNGPDIDSQEINTSFWMAKDRTQSIEPSNIRARGIITPIFKLGYFKLGEAYGIELTLLKALYDPPADMSIANDDYGFAIAN